MARAQLSAHAFALQPAHIMTIAVISGALFAGTLWLQISSRAVQTDQTLSTNATLARSIATVANNSNAPLQELAALAREIDRPLNNTAICVIDRNGDIIFHSKNPAAVGQNVTRVQLQGGQSVGSLLATKSDWIGENTSVNNVDQIIAYRYWSQIGGLIAVHTPLQNSGSLHTAIATVALILCVALLLGAYIWHVRRPESIATTRAIDASRTNLVAARTAAIAHDINNLLSVIQGNADVIASRTPSESSMNNLRKLIHASRMISQLNQRLTALHERRPTIPEPCDLSKLLADFKHQWLCGLDLKAQISCTAEADLMVEIDQLEFMQILLNLVMNAGRAAPDPKDHIEVALTRVPCTPAKCRPRSIDRPCARLSVTDSGDGIAPDLLPQLFRTIRPRRSAAGHGVGLTAVYAIVEQAQGAVAAKNIPNHGARFEVYLPLRT